MIELSFVIIVALQCLVALSDWRSGLLPCIFLDVIRDPVRKLEGQPLWIKLPAMALWLAVFARAYSSEHHRMLDLP